jgi:hypothetical protein
MVMSKDELIASLQQEVRLLLHLAGKAGPEHLDYRPIPEQRSLLELLQYLTFMGPIHLRAVLAERFDMDTWRTAWQTGESSAKTLDLEGAKAAIAQHAGLITDLLGACSDADLRAEIEMFGSKASRGAMLVSLVLNHYVAYRMQLFLYVKAAGRPELNTMNLWVGRDKF